MDSPARPGEDSPTILGVVIALPSAVALSGMEPRLLEGIPPSRSSDELLGQLDIGAHAAGATVVGLLTVFGIAVPENPVVLGTGAQDGFWVSVIPSVAGAHVRVQGLLAGAPSGALSSAELGTSNVLIYPMRIDGSTCILAVRAGTAWSPKSTGRGMTRASITNTDAAPFPAMRVTTTADLPRRHHPTTWGSVKTIYR
jgi:hypothetical protein